MEAKICKCNNCDAILYDENPKIWQKAVEIDNLGQKVVEMELLEEDGESFWACPNCQTDAYLMDFE